METCAFCGKSAKSKNSNAQHQIRCRSNPERLSLDTFKNKTRKPTNQYIKAAKEGRSVIISDVTREKISKGSRRACSDDTKMKISNSMKTAHAEGRAWNIGQSRWNNKPSYPETFFMRVIENEFDDKNYVREHPVGRYSLDFAWLDKKLCVEIDGHHHQRFQEQMDRDAAKDRLLEEKGWKVLRISWVEMFNDPKKWIKISHDFIHAVQVDQDDYK